MLVLSELEQLVTFARCGTLCKAAELLHTSQPTLTRTMRHVEEAFGVSLFSRGKNRIELNETGRIAVEYAERLLLEEQKAIQAVQDYDRSLHTILVKTCAPAPLWTLLPALSHRFPEKTISSQIADTEGIIRDVAAGKCDIGILPDTCPDETLVDQRYIKECLSVDVPDGHALSGQSRLTFEQLNGFNCLLKDRIGFWTELVQDQMPASRFLIQTDAFAFDELVKNSTLLSFSTNLSEQQKGFLNNRKAIPLQDEMAQVQYHLICQPKNRWLLPSK